MNQGSPGAFAASCLVMLVGSTTFPRKPLYCHEILMASFACAPARTDGTIIPPTSWALHRPVPDVPHGQVFVALEHLLRLVSLPFLAGRRPENEFKLNPATTASDQALILPIQLENAKRAPQINSSGFKIRYNNR
jgi:hypothetical protein